MMKTRIISLLSAAMLLLSANVKAQTLSVKDIDMETGGQAEVVVSLTGGTGMTALQFNLQLPDGLTANTGSITLGAATDGHTLCVETLESGDLLFILYSMSLKTFKDGELLRIPVEAGDISATATGQLYTVRSATADAVSHGCANATFDVKVMTSTGITKVTDTKDVRPAVFNLNGQRVQKAQKGIYLIDGKKVIMRE